MANTTKLTWVEQLGYTLVILIDRQFMLWFPHGFCLGWTQTRWSSALPVQGQGSSTDNRSIERPSWGTVPSWRRREGWWWPRWPGGESTPLTGPGFGGHLCVLPMYCCQTRYWWLHGASAVRGKGRGARFSGTYCTSRIRDLIPGLISPGFFLFCYLEKVYPWAKLHKLQVWAAAPPLA